MNASWLARWRPDAQQREKMVALLSS